VSVDWFRAVQALLSVGLIMLLISLLLIAIYMCIHTVSKNSTIIALVCFCLLSGNWCRFCSGHVSRAGKKASPTRFHFCRFVHGFSYGGNGAAP